MAEVIDDIADGFERWQALLLLALQGLGSLIWWYQNARSDRLGGRISFIKAQWLAYAIVLWLVVPCLLATRHWTMAALAISVGVRAAIEVPLCLRRQWKVGYGMVHNIFHLALCLIALVTLARADPQSMFLMVIVALTILALVTEMIFVSWFRKATDGPEQGIYFVPGGESFRRVNRATGWLFLPQYVTFLAVLIANLIDNLSA